MYEIINIIGRRWRDINGNTYHTSEIFWKGGYHKTDSQYGYGNQFKTTAIRYLESININIDNYLINDTVIDVSRKKDL